jgi:hypothetical protein
MQSSFLLLKEKAKDIRSFLATVVVASKSRTNIKSYLAASWLQARNNYWYQFLRALRALRAKLTIDYFVSESSTLAYSLAR